MFRNPYVRTIVVSRILLQLGIWIRNFAILLYVTDLTNNDPQAVSWISVAEYAPIFVFAIIGGTFADRWRPKRTMVWCDVLSSLSAVAVLVALMFGPWYSVLLGTLVSAVFSQFSQPSAMKLFKQHVPGEELQGVMAMFQTMVAVFMVVGPMIGTVIYQNYGIEVSLVVTAVMFLVSGFVLSRLPKDEMTSVGAVIQGSFRQELAEGFRYVYANSALRTLVMTFAVSGLAAGLIQPLMLFVAIDNLGQDKTFLQWLLMVNGAAMLVGGGVIMSAAKKLQPQVLLAVGLLLSALGTVMMGWSESILLTMAAQMINGFFYPWIHVGIQTMIMRNTDTAFIGRVGGAVTPVFMGMMVISMSLAGYLMDQLSLVTVFTVSGVLFLAGASILGPMLPKGRKSADFT
ncbi:MFS transporter [Paenibacillus xylanilyticus]|uniref:MFS transporter n=1 Tax=Paenibacillus xylanilyticus TaxID=248903 RepID=A0A7Y6BTB2_9BACL|nr:MFS transporter [Paenibacillus xylanilyticus]NUU74567.1 MFS transporter [Paenibacillus xylanilyticus]